MSLVPGNKPPRRKHVTDKMVMIVFYLLPAAEGCGWGCV